MHEVYVSSLPKPRHSVPVLGFCSHKSMLSACVLAATQLAFPLPHLAPSHHLTTTLGFDPFLTTAQVWSTSRGFATRIRCRR